MTPEGPCSWPHDPCPCEPLEAMSEAEQTEIVEMASWLLWAATGRVFGPCPVSVMPCQSPCGGCGSSLRACGCSSVYEVKLPGPVDSVTAVVVDGVTLDDTAYRVDDWEWLVRLDGGRWPTQNVTDPTAFRVDYMLGVAPPLGAGTVTGILAAELAKAKCNDKTCRLPAGVRTIQKQGITQDLSRGGGLLSPHARVGNVYQVWFGLPEVDRWVEAANAPGTLAGAVWSPDMPKVRRVTWSA